MNVVPMTPITNVKVLHGVSLDSSYTDTLDFSSVSAQSNYFSSKAKHNFTNLAPVRLQNAIGLPVNADTLYDCNYIMFQNAKCGSKRIYACIIDITLIY